MGFKWSSADDKKSAEKGKGREVKSPPPARGAREGKSLPPASGKWR